MPEHPWDRQPNEPWRAYAAFCIYRDLGPGRSLMAAAQRYLTAEDLAGIPLAKCQRQRDRYRQHPQPKKYLRAVQRNWCIWSRRWSWVERCDAYDDHLHELAESERLESQLRIRQAEIEENERQARTRLGTLRLGRTVVSRIVARMAQEIEDRALDQLSLREIMPHLARISALLETCIKNERLELGEATVRTETVDATPEDIVLDGLGMAELERLRQRARRLLEGQGDDSSADD